jgi:hypothetical protein
MKTRADERGAGLFSTAMGIAFFVGFLMLATHLLVNLWARSTVMHVAQDAARAVASRPDDPASAADEALGEAYERLGRHGEEVRFSFESDPSGNAVILHVQAEPVGLIAASPIGRIDERIVIRWENR